MDSEYVFRKPSARLFRLALEKAGLQPKDVWYIGDNYECDVEGARNAGLFPVWYIGATQEMKEVRSDVLIITDWGELEEYLKKLV